MNRDEKLRLSADAEWCHSYKHGLFARFYEQSLYWFSHTVKPLKPMLERVKGGDPVVYGGLPISSFEKLLEDGVLQQVETTDYGWRWSYAGQKELPEDAPDFETWRTEALSAMHGAEKSGNGVRDVLAEIAAFNLATYTSHAGHERHRRMAGGPARLIFADAAKWSRHRREGAGEGGMILSYRRPAEDMRQERLPT